MELSYNAAQELRVLAGNVRVLAYVMEPVPNRPDVERAVVIKGLDLLAAELDRLALRAERCRTCPHKEREGRP